MAELIPLRRDESYFDSRGRGNIRFHEYIEAASTAINTSTDNNEETATQIASAQSAIAELFELQKRVEVVIFATTDITLLPFETVICNNILPMNAILPINAIKGDKVNIKRKNKAVNVIGTIDGFINMCINERYYSMKLIFDGVEWGEI